MTYIETQLAKLRPCVTSSKTRVKFNDIGGSTEWLDLNEKTAWEIMKYLHENFIKDKS